MNYYIIIALCNMPTYDDKNNKMKLQKTLFGLDVVSYAVSYNCLMFDCFL